MESRTMHGWFWVWDFDKEEEWLGDMALNGWVLESVHWFTYRFTRCEPGEYSVRLEMHPGDDGYINFMEETGAEYVGRVLMWVYFRKKTADGPFDLFSDIDSRIGHLNKIGRMLAVIGGMNLLIGVLNTFNPSRMGWVNLLCATLLMYALGRIHGKKEALERERVLHE